MNHAAEMIKSLRDDNWELRKKVARLEIHVQVLGSAVEKAFNALRKENVVVAEALDIEITKELPKAREKIETINNSKPLDDDPSQG